MVPTTTIVIQLTLASQLTLANDAIASQQTLKKEGNSNIQAMTYDNIQNWYLIKLKCTVMSSFQAVIVRQRSASGNCLQLTLEHDHATFLLYCFHTEPLTNRPYLGNGPAKMRLVRGASISNTEPSHCSQLGVAILNFLGRHSPLQAQSRQRTIQSSLPGNSGTRDWY